MVGSSGVGVDKGKGVGAGVSQITKLFVSNLQEGSTPWEDKAGNRFGFISFKYVNDWKELVKKINGVNMGGCKLKVNVARFAVENNGIEGVPERRMNGDGESERLKTT
ncbi:putative nucleotide-binding alpha-beta plait domain superfamily, RNA-binding domain superfamily [Helianthus anomalus]